MSKEGIDVSFDFPAILTPMLDPHRFKVAEGGRGGGKSHFFANCGVKEVFTYGKSMLCCREIQGSIKDSVKRLIENKIVLMGLSQYFTVTNAEIRCYNGGRISFSGLRQQGGKKSSAENLKSYENYDICWVEEAQTISKLSLDLLLPTIRKPGSEIWFSYNRKADEEAVHTRFVLADNIPKDTVHIYINYWDNPWFPKELKDLMESDKANSPDDYNHIWCGLPQTISDANILTNWKVIDFMAPPGTDFRYGADWGFSPDPCVLLRSWADWEIRRIYIDHCVFKWNLDPEQIEDHLFRPFEGARYNKTICDNARPEIIAYLKKRGYNVTGEGTKWNGSVEAGCDWLKHWEVWIHPRCLCTDPGTDDIQKNFKNYRRKIDPMTGLVTPTIIDAHNHAPDALRYAWSKEISQKGAIDYIKMMGKKKDTKYHRQDQIAQAQALRQKAVSGMKGLAKNLQGQYIHSNDIKLKLPGINNSVIL